MELNAMSRLARRQPRFSRKNQAGVGLVEIMIALVIGLVLTAGVSQIYLSSKQTYRLQDSQSRLQENSRYALELLTKDIRMAGYAGCANITSITPNVIADEDGDNVADVTFSSTTAVFGYDYGTSSWNPSLPSALSGLSNPPLAGTDVITVQLSQGCGAHLTGNMDAVNANIQIMAPNSCGIDAGDTLLISDCVAADVFRASNSSESGGKETIAHAENVNIDVNLSKAYQQDAEIFNFVSRTYYVANGAGGQPALWQMDNTDGTVLELVEGVENMQILYGEDTDADRVPNQYLPVNSVSNLANVVAVRLSLLMRTLDNNIVQAAQTYSYDTDNDGSGESVTAADRRLRRVFTTTINLRNRSP